MEMKKVVELDTSICSVQSTLFPRKAIKLKMRMNPETFAIQLNQKDVFEYQLWPLLELIRGQITSGWVQFKGQSTQCQLALRDISNKIVYDKGRSNFFLLFEFRDTGYNFYFEMPKTLDPFNNRALKIVNVYLQPRIQIPPSLVYKNPSRGLPKNNSKAKISLPENNVGEIKHFFLVRKNSAELDRLVFPVSGYFLLIWKAWAKLQQRPFEQVAVILDNVIIFRDISLPANRKPVQFLVNILRKTGQFQIRHNDDLVARGTVRSLSLDQVEYQHIETVEHKDTEKMELIWTGNWVTFFDSIIQIMVLNQSEKSCPGGTSKGLSTFGHLDRAVLDPQIFLQHIYQGQQSNFSRAGKVLVSVYSSRNGDSGTTTVSTEGLEFTGWKGGMTSKSCRLTSASTLGSIIVERYKFTPDFSDTEEKTAEIVDLAKNYKKRSAPINPFLGPCLKSKPKPKKKTSRRRKNEDPVQNAVENFTVPQNIQNKTENFQNTPESKLPETDHVPSSCPKSGEVVIPIETEVMPGESLILSTVQNSSGQDLTRFSKLVSQTESAFSYVTSVFILFSLGVLFTFSTFLRLGVRIYLRAARIFTKSEVKLAENCGSSPTPDFSNTCLVFQLPGVATPSRVWKMLEEFEKRSGNYRHFLYWRFQKGFLFNYWRRDPSFSVKNHVIFDPPKFDQENVHGLELDHQALKMVEFYSIYDWPTVNSKDGQGFNSTPELIERPQWEFRIISRPDREKFLLVFAAHNAYGVTANLAHGVQKAVENCFGPPEFCIANGPISDVDLMVKCPGTVASQKEPMNDVKSSQTRGETCGSKMIAIGMAALGKVRNVIDEMTRARQARKMREAHSKIFQRDLKLCNFKCRNNNLAKSLMMAQFLAKAEADKYFCKCRLNCLRNQGRRFALQGQNIETPLYRSVAEEKSWIVATICGMLANPLQNLAQFLILLDTRKTAEGGMKRMIVMARDGAAVSSMVKMADESVFLKILEDLNQNQGSQAMDSREALENCSEISSSKPSSDEVVISILDSEE